MKVVSLLPSATEIVCCVGMECRLVGVSHECDFPRSASVLPKLTRSRVDHEAPSVDIHTSVLDLMQRTLSVYDLDLEQLQRLQPDVVVTQDLCDVCAVPRSQVQEACRQVLGEGVRMISLNPARLDDVWNDIRRVAEELEVPDAAREVLLDADRRIQDIRSRIPGLPLKRVLTIEWFDPVYIGGLWVPDMIEICGGEALLAEPGERAQKPDRAALEACAPDVVLVKPCGFKLCQTLEEYRRLLEALPWDRWPATRLAQVYLVDGNSYFNRPGPRLVDSLEILAACMHPEAFPELKEFHAESVIHLQENLTLP